MLRLLICLTLLLAVLAAPVQAQRRGGGGAAAGPTPEELDKKRQEEALDLQYKSTLKRMRTDNTPTRIDPWANMRGSDSAKR